MLDTFRRIKCEDSQGKPTCAFAPIRATSYGRDAREEALLDRVVGGSWDL